MDQMNQVKNTLQNLGMKIFLIFYLNSLIFQMYAVFPIVLGKI